MFGHQLRDILRREKWFKFPSDTKYVGMLNIQEITAKFACHDRLADSYVVFSNDHSTNVARNTPDRSQNVTSHEKSTK